MRKLFNLGMAVILLVVFAISLMSVSFAEISIYDGKVTISDSLSNGSGTAASYTATAKGSMLSKKSNTVTITNKSDSVAKIGFDYTVSKASSFNIDSTVTDTSGSYSKELAADETITISMTSNSGFSNLTVTLTLTNITYEVKATSANVTVEYNDALGTVTADGAAVANGGVVTVGETDVTFAATPATGAQFFGWVEEDGRIITRETSYAQGAFSDKKVKAVFSAGTPCFMVDDLYIFDNLTDATACTGSKIVLLCNGTLPAGDYTIRAGQNLIIPFDAANTYYTTTPSGPENSYTKPTAYRTLTMAEGAHIYINGAVSVPAMQSSKQGYNGAPTGTYGHIAMQSGSSITVNNGGNLYAWGFISGQGSVTVKNGGTVYECFQVTDWRGGNAVLDMVDNEQGVFPMSQYYVQNIEVPMTLEAGAIENGYMTAYVTGLGNQGTAVPFIGPDGMFEVTEGNIVKDYQESTDRLLISINNGTLNMSPLSLSMKLSVFGTKTIHSQKYVLPINSNITLNVNAGSAVNVSQNIALLPGSEINVNQGAECTFVTGVKAYIYDADEWGGYCSHLNVKLAPVKYAPGKQKTRTEADLVDARLQVAGVVNALEGSAYSTTSGADVSGVEGGIVKIKPVAEGITYQASYNATDKTTSYPQIAVKSAELKNDDGTYVTPVECYPVYEYKNNVWTRVEAEATHTSLVTEPGVDATCTESGLTEKIYCSACNTVIKEQTAVSALGHDKVSHEAKAQSCEGIGWDAYETCTRCDYTTYVELPALGHNKVSVEAKAQTCDGIGWDAYEKCTRCDYTTYVELPALGHDTVSHEAKEQTCDGIGWDAYETCTRCDYTTYVELPALGHDKVSHEAKAQSCEGIGWDAYETCTRCDYTTYVELPALGHNKVSVEAKAQTCDSIGWDAYEKCTRCDYTTYVELPALGHDYGDWSAVDGETHKKVCKNDATHVVTGSHNWGEGAVTKPATHTEDGVMTYTCSECGSTKTEEIPAKVDDHTYGDWYEVDGETHRRDCECSDFETGTHNWGEGAVTKPATHTEAGVKTYTCSECGATKTEEIPAKVDDHTYGDWYEVDGETHRRDCECSDFETGTHNWGEGAVTKPATHTEAGVKTYTCSECGATKTEEIPAEVDNHTYGDWYKLDDDTHRKDCACGDFETDIHNWDGGVVTTAATHTTDGVMTYTCSECNGTKTEVIPAKVDDHNWSQWTKEDNINHVQNCECGDVIREEHDWDEGVVTVPETHTTPGEITYTCPVCTGTKTEVIPAKDNDHSWSDWTLVDDDTHQRECACGDVETDSHSWDAGTVTVPATHTEDGEMTYNCSVCNGTKTEEIPAEVDNHTYDDWTWVDDTFHKHECGCGASETEEHTFDGVECTVCGGTKALASVKGTVTSYLAETETVTISLFKESESTASYTATVTGNSAEYTIANVANGTYKMVISKANHVTLEETVTVADEDATKNVKICPKGDVNGSGTITTVDFSMANSHAKEINILSGYRLKCADVVGTDGRVTTADAMRINSHAKEISLLW